MLSILKGNHRKKRISSFYQSFPNLAASMKNCVHLSELWPYDLEYVSYWQGCPRFDFNLHFNECYMISHCKYAKKPNELINWRFPNITKMIIDYAVTLRFKMSLEFMSANYFMSVKNENGVRVFKTTEY